MKINQAFQHMKAGALTYGNGHRQTTWRIHMPVAPLSVGKWAESLFHCPTSSAFLTDGKSF